MILAEIKDKKTLILGLGREGQDCFLFLRKIFPQKELGLADQLNFKKLPLKFKKILKKDKKISLHLGKNYLQALKKYQLIIKSPGIPPHLPELERAKKKKKTIISPTQIFFEICQGKIIGITGTKGKSTTATLIYQILKRAGFKVELCGNIGRAALSLLLKPTLGRIFVFELSCHQLYGLKKSPQIAIFLNLYPEHLDFYQLKEYYFIKKNITRYQQKKDILIYNASHPEIKKAAKKSKAKKIPIYGKYYDLNFEAAKKVAKIFGISSKVVNSVFENFKFLPHRLEYLGKYQGIDFYNDSLSTIPQTTIEALDFLGNKVETLILGGFDRGLNFKNLAKRVIKSKVKTLILFPTTGKRIWQEIMRHLKGRKIQPFFVKNMKEAVKLAYSQTEREKICLLSPASPSFGIFRDYQERGELFKKYVKFFGKNGKIKK